MSLLFSLLGFTRMLREWAGIALRWALTPIWHLLLVACVLLAGHDWLGWHGKAKAEKVLASTVIGYHNAQAEAKRQQDALNLAISARYSDLAKESDHDHQKALGDAHSAVVRYVSMHTCPASQASGTSAAAVSGDSGVAVGPGISSDMVAITVADLDQFAGNTVRAESCRAWGQSLIDAGLAVAGG